MARKMKDSGIEWIGEIPEGWSVSKVLHYLSIVTSVLSQKIAAMITTT